MRPQIGVPGLFVRQARIGEDIEGFRRPQAQQCDRCDDPGAILRIGLLAAQEQVPQTAVRQAQLRKTQLDADRMEAIGIRDNDVLLDLAVIEIPQFDIGIQFQPCLIESQGRYLFRRPLGVARLLVGKP
jgi:hypothetical protein